MSHNDSASVETWRDIPGFEGTYQVSDLGRARSLPGGLRHAKVLKPVRAGKNYLKVCPCIGGKVAPVYVHHAVAAAFLGPRPDGLDVLHNNGDTHDNRVENLRYDTVSANNRDAVAQGTHGEARRTHCDHGHEFSLENTLIQANGVSVDGVQKYRRRCRECARLQSERWNRSKAAKAA